MAQGKRVTGFVVGHDKKGTESVWKVRVKDQTSFHDGTKFEVVSKRSGIELKPSTDVTFRIEPFQVEGEFVLKAVDVAVGPVNPEPRRQPEEDVSEGSFTIKVWATEMIETGEVNVYVTGLESLQEALAEIDGEAERVLAFHAINMQPPHLGVDEHVGLETIECLFRMDNTRDALEYLITEIFKLGQRNPKA